MVSDILDHLTSIPISLEVHESTRIGRVVTDIKKTCTVESISMKAKELISLWKKIVKMNSETNDPKAIMSAGGGSKKNEKNELQEDHKQPSLRRESSEDDDRYLNALSEQRRKMFSKLKDIFLGANSSQNRIVANALALAIENAIDRVCPFVKESKLYLQKCRDCCFNLTKNSVYFLKILIKSFSF
jgi:hypothetical protein